MPAGQVGAAFPSSNEKKGRAANRAAMSPFETKDQNFTVMRPQ